MIGKIEGIHHANSTKENELFVYPITVAEAVKMPNGEMLSNFSLSSSNSKYKDKIIYCFGDSITRCGYPDYIRDILGAKVYNFGINVYKVHQVYNLAIEKNFDEVSAVTIMIGFNSAPPSDLTLENSGILTEDDPTNYPDNYIGWLAKTIEYIQSKNLKCRIYLCSTHMPRGHSSITKEPEYNRCMKEVAKYYSLPFIDVFNECGICQKNKELTLADAIHPNEIGTELIGTYIAYQMLAK